LYDAGKIAAAAFTESLKSFATEIGNIKQAYALN